MIDIAKRIREHRADLGLTANEYGRMFGRDRQQVFLWERGVSKPGGSALAKMVDAELLTAHEAVSLMSDGAPMDAA